MFVSDAVHHHRLADRLGLTVKGEAETRFGTVVK